MTLIKTKLRRRHLLAGMGAGALALPFLSRLPSAEAAGFPKRFVVFFSPNEPIEKSYWQPSNDLTLTPVMQPLQPFADKLVLIGDMKMHTRDVDPFGGGHVGMGHLLTGRVNIPYGSKNPEFWAGGISVDQHIANQLGVEALTLAARPGGASGNGRLSYTGASEPVHPIEDPLKAFDQLLGDYTLPEDELADKYAQRGRVLDAVAGQLGSLKSKLGTADANKLAIHLQQIEELEAALTNGGVISCTPTAPAGGFDYKSNADYPVTGRRQIDVLVQALACDVTRVGSIQLGNSGGGNLTPQWAGDGIDISIDEHNIAHNYNSAKTSANIANREELESFYYRQFAYLLDKLDSVPEGDGTLLDNTLVLWGKPIGRNHSGDQLLFMLAGGAGGDLETGRYLEANDVPHNNLLVSCCQLMGLGDQSFGDPEICTGALSL